MKSEIETEAKRIAKQLIKDEMKRQGIKPAWVEAEDVSEAVKALLKAKPNIYKAAKREIKRREKQAKKLTERRAKR